MGLESLNRRMEELEELAEPCVIALLHSGEQRVYSESTIRAALRDAAGGWDTPMLQELCQIAACKDEGGLMGHVRMIVCIYQSRKRDGAVKPKEMTEDATKNPA